jgi:hypothetical protein
VTKDEVAELDDLIEKDPLKALVRMRTIDAGKNGPMIDDKYWSDAFEPLRKEYAEAVLSQEKPDAVSKIQVRLRQKMTFRCV